MSDDALPLHLNLAETQALLSAVEMMIRLDSAVLLHEDVQQLAQEQIRDREGVGGVARADQALAGARERLPLLWQLREKLGEQLEQFHGTGEE